MLKYICHSCSEKMGRPFWSGIAINDVDCKECSFCGSNCNSRLDILDEADKPLDDMLAEVDDEPYI